MGIVLGWLCLVSFLGLMAKFVTRVLGLQKANRFLMKLHKPLAVSFLALCFFHILFVLPVFRTRAWSIYATGIGIVLISLLLILLCHLTKKGKRSKVQWHRYLSFIMLFLAIGHMVVYQIDFNHYTQIISNLQVGDIDTSNMANGSFIGEYDAGYIYAKVQVDIKDNQITNIRLLEHRNEHGKPAEQMIPDIVQKQSLQVDAVSGATNSSKVIKKAIEIAIKEQRIYD